MSEPTTPPETLEQRITAWLQVAAGTPDADATHLVAPAVEAPAAR